MKSFVALLLILATFGSGAIIQGQTPPRKNNQNAPNKPHNETLRICQGVPIPDGYVIIAYMTSSACPHGAYLLKKQDGYEKSLAVNRAGRSADDSKGPGGGTSTKSPGSALPTNAPSVQAAKTGSSPVTNNSGVAMRSGGNSGQNIASGTRPRRVGASDSEPNPPTLLGNDPATPKGPPTLRGVGNTNAAGNSGDSADKSSDPTSPPGPEEVGEGDVVRVDTTLVTVPVSVLDRQGRFIPNLQRDDFKIFENGVEQPIAYFEPAEKPFTVALLLDTSASTHFHLDEIREAAIAFAKQLRPQDRVLIVSFNDEVLLLTEATNDLNVIETVIEENANSGSSTRLYDAVDLTIRERLNQIKGRKAIVLFTDGVDTSSQDATYQSTLSEVEELDALIYPIQYDTTDYLRAMQNANGNVTVITTRSGPFGTTTTRQVYNSPMNGGVPMVGATKADYDRADHYLHSLAEKTGGRLYQANDTKQLADAFARIAEELRRQYTLGYYPKNDNADTNDRRQIRVKVRQSNYAVKARESYTKSSSTSPTIR